MLATPPNPATISLPPSRIPNPATIPLPPSRVESPLDVGSNKGTKPQRTSYLATPGSGGYTQRYHRPGDARDAKYSSRSGGASAIDNRLSLGPKVAVGNRDSTCAGTAANIAVRSHRPFEAVSPETTPSAMHVAAMATKEARVVHTESTQLSSFAHSAAVLAQKAAGEGAAVVIHPHFHSFSHNGPFDDDEHFVASDTSTQIHNAAAKSVFKAMPQAVEAPLAATESPQPRRMLTANLEEAARKAAARRLALLDQELYQSSAIRRPSYPDNDQETRQSVSPYRRYSMRDGATMRSQMPRTYGADPYANLLDIAKRNVENKLAGIDLQVANKRGIAYRKDWENQAMRLAETRARNMSPSGREGKIDIGGGGYVDREVVERIAQRNVQPVLDEITARAETERARVAAERADAEERKRLEIIEKERNREIKVENRRAKAAEKSEIARQKSEAKRQKRVSKLATHGSIATIGDNGTNYTTQDNRSHGGTETTATREMPTSPPLQEPKSKLRKLIGKLRRSMTPPSTGSEGGFIGGASYAQERERERERVGRVATSAGGDEEQLGGGVGRRTSGTLGGPVDDVSPNRDAVSVEGNLPVALPEARRDIGSGGVFWDRVEFIDPEGYGKRQAEENVGRIDRHATPPILNNPKGPMASRSIDGMAGAVSEPLHPLRQTTSLPRHDAPFSSSAEYSGSAGSTNIQNCNIEKGTPADMDTSSRMAGGGRERGSAVPLYDHPTHPIDVTVMQAVGQAQGQKSITAERDMRGNRLTRVKSVKSVRIEDPQVDQQQFLPMQPAPHHHHSSLKEEQMGADGSEKPKESKFHEDL